VLSLLLREWTNVVQHSRMNTPDTQLKLRIPVDLKARLEDASASAGRSLTAEIVTRLE